LNAIVSPGKRAFTVATDTETAVAGLLQPGNYVDIIVTIRPEDPSAVGAKWVAKTILQGIKVLAVGNSMSVISAPTDPKAKNQPPAQQRNIKPSITLELLPEEAEQLALATSQGDIHVTLRTDTDFTQIENQTLTTASRIIGVTSNGTPNPPMPDTSRNMIKPEEPAGPTAEVISGGTKTEVTFENNGTTTEKIKTPKRQR